MIHSCKHEFIRIGDDCIEVDVELLEKDTPVYISKWWETVWYPLLVSLVYDKLGFIGGLDINEKEKKVTEELKKK